MSCAVVVVSGSTNQPSINGRYTRHRYELNGQAAFAMADESYVLYYDNSEGRWVVAKIVGDGFRAAEQAGASPTGTELPWSSRSWRTEGGAIAMSMIG